MDFDAPVGYKEPESMASSVASGGNGGGGATGASTSLSANEVSLCAKDIKGTLRPNETVLTDRLFRDESIVTSYDHFPYPYW